MNTDDELQRLWRNDNAPPTRERRFPMFTSLEDRIILHNAVEGLEDGRTRLIGLAAFVVLALGAIQDGLRASGALEIAGNIIILLAPMALLIRELRLRKQTSHPDQTAATASYWRGLVRVYEQRKRAERRWSIGFFCALSAGFALTLTSAVLPALQARQVQSGVIAECLIDVVALVGVSLFVRKRRRHLQEALQLLADGESVPWGN